MRALVESVAAPLVAAGPAPAGMRLEYHDQPSGPGGGRCSRQPGQPRPDHDHSVVVTFSHAHMTPPPALL
jgi:hypothetical protein